MTGSRRVLVLVFVSVATLLAFGAAFDVPEDCGGGTCQGTDGDDVLHGTPRIDKIFGQGGDYRVNGYRNPDTLKGGGGADALYGGGGDEVIRASTMERVDEGARDVIDCGGGTDKVYVVPGQDDAADDCEIRSPPTL